MDIDDKVRYRRAMEEYIAHLAYRLRLLAGGIPHLAAPDARIRLVEHLSTYRRHTPPDGYTQTIRDVRDILGGGE